MKEETHVESGTINSFELLDVHMFSFQFVCAKDILHDIFMHHEHPISMLIFFKKQFGIKIRRETKIIFS